MNEKNFIKTTDNIKINYKKDIPSEIKGIVIIVHGFAEHLQRYNYFVAKLNENNYGCYRFDNRGHGESEGDYLDLKDYNDFLRDTDMIVQLAKKEYPGLPVFMFGHSMGGFITALYGEKYQNSLDGQILSGAATDEPIALNGALKVLIKIGNTLFPTMRVKSDLSELVCSDKNVVTQFRNDPLIHNKATFRFYKQFMLDGINELKNKIKDYKYDCLVLHGKEDKIISYKCSENFVHNISSTNKTIKIYDNLYHEILNESVKDEIINDIVDWLNKKSQ